MKFFTLYLHRIVILLTKLCRLRKFFFCCSPHHSSRFRFTITCVRAAAKNMALQNELLAKAEDVADQVIRNLCGMKTWTYMVSLIQLLTLITIIFIERGKKFIRPTSEFK
jgi:hypothetical protein